MRKPFIVAEMSANHLGSIDRAKEIINAAHICGADAVKLQTFRPASMVRGEYVVSSGCWGGKKILNLYEDAYTPWDWHPDLFDYAESIGVTLFSSPFCLESVAFLEKMGCPMYKIASFELTDTQLVRAVAKTGKPIIMSTGMASKEEIRTAVNEAKSYGPRDITLLKCTSAYPSTAENANLSTMQSMYFDFKTHVGISDHSEGIGVACAAAGLGASVIEKHLTISRADGGPDASFSMEPKEFAQMVKECRKAYAARGSIQYGPSEEESESYKLRRSLYTNKDMKEGDVITEKDVITARPFGHISPQDIDKVIGSIIIKDISKNKPLSWDCISAYHD